MEEAGVGGDKKKQSRGKKRADGSYIKKKKKRRSSDLSSSPDKQRHPRDGEEDDEAEYSSSEEENEFSAGEEEEDSDDDDDDDEEEEDSDTQHGDEDEDDPHRQRQRVRSRSPTLNSHDDHHHHDNNNDPHRSRERHPSDDEGDSDHEERQRRKRQRKLQKKLKHSAAHKIQSQWKKKKGDTNSGTGGGDDDDGDDDHGGGSRSKPKAAPSASEASHGKESPSKEDDHQHHPSRSKSDGEGAHDDEAGGNTGGEKKKKKAKGKAAKTVPPPVAEIIEWNRTLSIKKARKHVQTGLRVKVRFATKVKRDGKIIRKKKWFGGRVAAASKEGSKIRIKYDDGTAEISKFPDKDVVVDSAFNGEHQVSASKFLPPGMEPGDPETAVDDGEGVSAIDATLRAFANEDDDDDEPSQAEGEGDKQNSMAPKPSPAVAPKKLKSLVTDVQVPSPPIPHKEIVSMPPPAPTIASITSAPSAPNAIMSPPSPGKIDYTEKATENTIQKQVVEATPGIASKEDKVEEMEGEPSAEETSKASLSKEPKDDDKATLLLGSSALPEEPHKKDSMDDNDDEGLIVETPADHQSEVSKEAQDAKEMSSAARVEEPAPVSKLTIRIPNLQKERRDSGKDPKSPKLRVHLSLPSATRDAASNLLAEKSKSPTGEIVEKEQPDKKTSVADFMGGSKKRSMDDMERTATSDDSKVVAPPSKRIHIQKPPVATEDSTLMETDKPEKSSSLTLKLHVKRPSSRQDNDGEEKAGEDNTEPSKIADRPSSSLPEEKEDSPRNPEIPKLGIDVSTENDRPQTQRPVATKPAAGEAVTADAPLEAAISSLEKDKDKALPISGSSAFEQNAKTNETDMNETEAKLDHAENVNSSDAQPTSPREKLSAAIRTERKAAQQANERLVSSKDGGRESEKGKDADKEVTFVGKKRKKRDFGDGDSEGSKEEAKNTREDDNNWVQCDQCKKWRIIPNHIKISSLPERWYCNLNIYDAKRNSCDAPEQTARTPLVKKKKKGKKNRRQRFEALGDDAGDELKALSRQNSSQSIVVKENKVEEKVKEKARSRSPALKEDIKPKEKPQRSGGSTPRSPRASPPAVVEAASAPSVEPESPKPPPQKKQKKTRRLPDAPLEVAEVAEAAPPEVKVKRGRGGKSRRDKEKEQESETASGSVHGSVSSHTGQEDAENVEWVQCEKCDKWRKLPPHITAAELPDVWYCQMNTWNPGAASCSAAEDKADGQQDVRVDPDANSNKLSYRNLIFGTGRKMNRPLSERTRAAESIFVTPSADSEGGYPVVSYSNSSAFAPRGSRANIIEDEGSRIFDLMNHSSLWAELRGASQPFYPSAVESAGFGKPFQPKHTFETLPRNMKQDMIDMILQALGNKTLLGEEVLLECQCRQWDNSPPSWAEVRSYCTKDIVIALLCGLVTEGKVQLIQAFGTDWTVKDWNPRYRLASNARNENSAPPAPSKSKCMKIAKPWKRKSLSNY